MGETGQWLKLVSVTSGSCLAAPSCITATCSFSLGLTDGRWGTDGATRVSQGHTLLSFGFLGRFEKQLKPMKDSFVQLNIVCHGIMYGEKVLKVKLMFLLRFSSYGIYGISVNC